MTTQAPILEVRALKKYYGGRWFKKGYQALDGVDLAVGRGMVFGLLGPNGAGKTTLVKVLLGLLPRYEGEALLFGEPVSHASVRQRVGYLPESHRLPPYLTGRQVLLLQGMLCGRDKHWIEQRIPAWLEKVGMREAADRKVKEYSKGMMQRIGLAQALIHEPELVFLDEPTDGVDPVGRAAVREIVLELKRQGTTVFINSHLLMEVELISDAIVIMAQGKILRSGSVAELTPHTGLVRVELEPVPEGLETLLAGLGANLVRAGRGFELNASQVELDQIVDRLRARGISLCSIEQQRLSLEQTFLHLLGGKR